MRPPLSCYFSRLLPEAVVPSGSARSLPQRLTSRARLRGVLFSARSHDSRAAGGVCIQDLGRPICPHSRRAPATRQYSPIPTSAPPFSPVSCRRGSATPPGSQRANAEDANASPSCHLPSRSVRRVAVPGAVPGASGREEHRVVGGLRLHVDVHLGAPPGPPSAAHPPPSAGHPPRAQRPQESRAPAEPVASPARPLPAGRPAILHGPGARPAHQPDRQAPQGRRRVELHRRSWALALLPPQDGALRSP